MYNISKTVDFADYHSNFLLFLNSKHLKNFTSKSSQSSELINTICIHIQARKFNGRISLNCDISRITPWISMKCFLHLIKLLKHVKITLLLKKGNIKFGSYCRIKFFRKYFDNNVLTINPWKNTLIRPDMA